MQAAQHLYMTPQDVSANTHVHTHEQTMDRARLSLCPPGALFLVLYGITAVYFSGVMVRRRHARRFWGGPIATHTHTHTQIWKGGSPLPPEHAVPRKKY